MLPVFLCLKLLPPFLGQRREHSDSAAVFICVSQAAAFCHCTESDPVLARSFHVKRIDRKSRINRRVLANPEKRFLPLVFRCGPGPLDVRS